jgi:hypothetical protein
LPCDTSPLSREGDSLYTKNVFFGFSKKYGDIQVDVINDKNGNFRQLIAHFELRSMQLDKVK